MKRRLSYLMLCAVAMLSALTACIDDNIVDPDAPGNEIEVRLRLLLPGCDPSLSRAAGQDTEFGELDYNTALQRNVTDVRILVFEERNGESILMGLVENLTVSGENDSQVREIKGKYRSGDENVHLAVLCNLSYNVQAVPDFESLRGKSEQEVYENILYSYPEAGLILSEERGLPMWGKTATLKLNANTIETTVSLYRAMAKMGVKVDDACTKFQLKEVYVYYDNATGYFAPPTVLPTLTDRSGNKQYSEPEIPTNAAAFTISAPQSYNVTNNVTMNQIFLSEVKNRDNESPMKIVVGGIYSGDGVVVPGEGNLSYYRIDCEDDYDEITGRKTTSVQPFDIVRNHSYIFNITGVDNPGTPTPESALDNDVAKLKVEIARYTDETMRGVPDQYTLTTSESAIVYDAWDDQSVKTIDVWTDYELGWSIEQIDGENTDWLTMENTTGGKNQTVQLKITPASPNRSLTRTAHFMVTAGNIKKQITVIQPQPPTANCYPVSDTGNPHTLIVGIKGNGNEGTVVYENGQEYNLLESGTALITPDKIGIIWETHAGLITLIDENNVRHSGAEKSSYDRATMSIKYEVNTAGASIGGVTGGNALIGAFDAQGKVIWSWHIWVCPGMVDANGVINEDYVEEWGLNDYDVMDRNLGALANRPVGNSSVASMGLLYQWGRKDPFIGPNNSNDNFTGNGRIPVTHYYEDWGTLQQTTYNNPIAYTVEHPTRLIYGNSFVINNSTGIGGTVQSTVYEGLSSMARNGSFLWGTDKGFDPTVIEVGSKTIYDPCPVGYRVPPVNTFVFSDNREHESYWRSVETNGKTLYNVDIRWATNNRGSSATAYTHYAEVNTRTNRPSSSYTYYRLKEVKTSLKLNWNENLIYVPHKVSRANKGYQDYGYISYYMGPYVRNGKYYGFYINHNQIVEPELNPSARTVNTTIYNLANDGASISWFPLTGAYDPSQGVEFKNSSGVVVSIQQGSSITVNSFLWTNSSVLSGNDASARRIPAAMFLHGTETGGDGNGRHIHGMTEPDIKAAPHYAGAVRCIKDRAKVVWSENKLPPTTSIIHEKGSKTTFTIISVGGDWKLVEPGAPWIKVTPDCGGKTPLAGKSITIEIIGDNVAVGQSTTLSFKIDGEAEPRKIIVTTT